MKVSITNNLFNTLAKEASSKSEAVRMMIEKNLLPFYGH
jgi:hypothetical protein